MFCHPRNRRAPAAALTSGGQRATPKGEFGSGPGDQIAKGGRNDPQDDFETPLAVISGDGRGDESVKGGLGPLNSGSLLGGGTSDPLHRSLTHGGGSSSTLERDFSSASLSPSSSSSTITSPSSVAKRRSRGPAIISPPISRSASRSGDRNDHDDGRDISGMKSGISGSGMNGVGGGGRSIFGVDGDGDPTWTGASPGDTQIPHSIPHSNFHLK